MTLGNKIRTRRQALKLTQPELAEKTKLTQGYISRIENDKFIPKASTLLLLAASLDLPAKELIGITERRAS